MNKSMILAFVALTVSFSAMAQIKSYTTYTGKSYEETTSGPCGLTINRVVFTKDGRIKSFGAKSDKHQILAKNLKEVYRIDSADGSAVIGYSNAPKTSFAGYDGRLSVFDYARSFGHLFLGTTLNVELDEKGNLKSSEYFGNIFFGLKERLCNFEK